MTQGQLGEACGYSQPAVSRLENGRSARTYDVRMLRRIAEALDIPSHLLGVVAHGAAEEDPSVRRREFISGTAAFSIGAQIPAIVPRVISADTVGWLWSELHSHLQADRAIGVTTLIDTVSSQCRTVSRLIKESKQGRLHRDLLRLGTAFTDFAGWLALDSGDLDAAHGWRSQSLEMALRSGDSEITAYALQSLAMVAVDAGDGARAVELSSAALRLPDQLPVRARVMATEQAAHGYALLGDRAMVDRLFAEIPELLDRCNDERDHPWGGNRFRHARRAIALQQATCYGRLGLGEEAVTLWDDAMDGFTPGYRDLGVYQARWARALVDAGAPETALQLAADSLNTFYATGSARMGRELSAVRSSASRDDSAGASEIADLLHAV